MSAVSAAVDAALASGKVNYWTGEHGKEFEREYAKFLGIKHAIALMNGTAALELPLRMWGPDAPLTPVAQQQNRKPGEGDAVVP